MISWLFLSLLASDVNSFVVDGMKQQQQQPHFFIATSACETEVPRQTSPLFEPNQQQQSSLQQQQPSQHTNTNATTTCRLYV
jgi:hypothetical protein